MSDPAQSEAQERREAANSGRLFLIFVVVFCFAAWFLPETFAQGKPLIVPLLSVVMLGMGFTLTPEDFRRVAEQPATVAVGTGLQFMVMPFSALAISKLLGLSDEATIGMVLVGACPGGTASNVIAYLSRADVALSVTLTAVSTLLAPLATPFLTSLLAGKIVDVNVAGLFLSVAKIVLAPVLVGLILRRFIEGFIEPVLKALVPFTSLVIALIIAIIVGASHGNFGAAVLPILPAVFLHNAIGLGAGYGISRLLKFPEQAARTIAIEVGMQNSGLAVALAGKFFSTAAALPGAVFSVWHNVSGAVLANFWAGRKNDS